MNKIEVNSLRNGYITDVLRSFDIEEKVKIGGKVIKTYEGVFSERISKYRHSEISSRNFSIGDQNINRKVKIFYAKWLN